MVVNACSRIQDEIGNVVGVCNLDVVEGIFRPIWCLRRWANANFVFSGTAMEALNGMMDIVSARPKGFASLEDAIAWQYVTSKDVSLIISTDAPFIV